MTKARKKELFAIYHALSQALNAIEDCEPDYLDEPELEDHISNLYSHIEHVHQELYDTIGHEKVEKWFQKTQMKAAA